MLAYCDTCNRKTRHLIEKGACLDHSDVELVDGRWQERKLALHPLTGRTVIPAYSEAKDGKKPSTFTASVIRLNELEAQHTIPAVMLNGVDIRLTPKQDTFPKIKTVTGELVDDPDMVQCSFCENVVHIKQATFGKGPMRDLKIEEPVTIGNEVILQTRWIKFSSKDAACPDCCLHLLPKRDRKVRSMCGEREDTRKTIFPETRG